MRIVIAGGGLAGLTPAHPLNRYGLDVAVHEHDTGIAARSPYGWTTAARSTSTC
ncbi:NAD(P)-binding protein [Streptomyces sp. SID13726]|uniref:FAD-binding protein n=1 Tax=Streptomyces sp. SID13726 TaxID=2706058 RepID=UPI0013B5EE6B|nr:NAD(P)-binding protein [Streptomyces sp. SID13726]NEB01168.1 NAD(P)-binding protein [Streptomyces sp. SID13726]